MHPITFKVFAFVKSQELRKRLAINSHAFLTCSADCFMRLFTAYMDNVKWYASGVCYCDGAVCSLAFKSLA